MGVAGAGFGAAQALEKIIMQQLLDGQAKAREQEAATRSQIDRDRLTEGARQFDVEQSRTRRIDDENIAARQQAKSAQSNQQGVRRMIGDAMMQRTGPMTPEDGRGIVALQLEAGDRPDFGLMQAPTLKRRQVTVKGPQGQPINRMADEDEEVEEYVKPEKPDTPSASDFQWVMRDGKPAEIRKGTSLPGDTPHVAPKTVSEDAQDRQRSARVEAAHGFLGRLNVLRKKINTKMGPEAGIAGTVRKGKAAIGMDPDVAEYQRLRAAGGRSLAVAIMGAQNLSDADAEAWANMLPDATTDEDTAGRLTSQVETMLDGMTGTKSKGAAATPDLSGLAPGAGRKFTEGPFAGQTWTLDAQGNPKKVGG